MVSSWVFFFSPIYVCTGHCRNLYSRTVDRHRHKSQEKSALYGQRTRKGKPNGDLEGIQPLLHNQAMGLATQSAHSGSFKILMG